MNSLAAAVFLGLILLADLVIASPYGAPQEAGKPQGEEAGDDYNHKLENLLMEADKRSCVRRGGSCDNRPNDCCYNSSCRCNLWGTNCRCQRAGLFQSWGK